jgi:hypothetical protein
MAAGRGSGRVTSRTDGVIAGAAGRKGGATSVETARRGIRGVRAGTATRNGKLAARPDPDGRLKDTKTSVGRVVTSNFLLVFMTCDTCIRPNRNHAAAPLYFIVYT